MTHSLICIGDSYTIGENVPMHENFPYQTLQKLRKLNLKFNAPEIIAKTGWTSFELIEHLNSIELQESYDFATLLIGVNNQYRGLSIEDFSKDFEFLINKSLKLIQNKANRLIVLSIPDWGVTPFAKDRNEQEISNEINEYNVVCKSIAEKYKAHFIDITYETRKAKYQLDLLTTDELHYSAIEHEIWANKIVDCIVLELNKN